ncbi:hypothetical protein D3C84_1073500 [compost metagenome]
MYFHHETQALFAPTVCNLDTGHDVCLWTQQLTRERGQYTSVDVTTTLGYFLQDRHRLEVNVVTEVERTEELIAVSAGWAEQQLGDLEACTRVHLFFDLL